jgi:hypothetical protein
LINKIEEIKSHQSLLSDTLNKLLELRLIHDDVEVWEDIIDMAGELKLVVSAHREMLGELLELVKNNKTTQELKSNMLVFEILNKTIENIKYCAKIKNRLNLSDNIDDVEELIIQYIRKENELLFPTIKELEKI